MAAHPVPAEEFVAQRIARIVSSVPGWSPEDQLLALHTLAVGTAALGGDIIEIGSWCGRSAAVIGHALRLCGAGRLHCVDLFPAAGDWRQNPDGTHSMAVRLGDVQVDAYHVATVWDEPFQRDIAPVYRRFASVLDAFHHTMRAEALDGRVVAYRGTAPDYVRAAGKDLRCRLAFIDGDHGHAAVVADIHAVEQLLVPGGWIAFDDAFTGYEGVDRAINECIVGNPAYVEAHRLTRKMFVARRARENGPT